jgi:hypothetical protein
MSNLSANDEPKEKSKFVREKLFRSPSELGRHLQEYTKHDTRKLYEQHNVSFQCEAVLGPFSKGRTCWLCGFPIEHLSSLKDSSGNYVFRFDGKRTQNKMLDRGVCEHVLPVKLGHGILELLQLEEKVPGENPALDKLLHTEYEFAHNYCNFIKTDEYFVTLPLGSTDFCNLQLKDDILDQVLSQIFHKQRGSKGSQQSSLVWTNHGGEKLEFKNIVQAYCFTMNTKAYKEDPEKVFKEVWFPKVKARIVDKINRVISYVKEADNCLTTNNTRGSHFRGFQKRLEEGSKLLPRGMKGPSFEKLAPKYKAKISALQRSPSYENILAATPESERLLPFRSPSMVGTYTVNYTDNTSPPSSRRASPKLSPNNSPISRTSTTSSMEDLFPNFRPLPNSLRLNNNSLRAQIEESRANLISTLAAELAADKSAAKSDDNNSNSNSNSNNNTIYTVNNNNNVSNELANFILGEEAAAKPRLARQEGRRNLLANKGIPTRRKTTNAARQALLTSYYTRKPQAPKKNEVLNLGKGLLATRKNNGYYMSGKTFAYKDKLKGLGASWNPSAKTWKVPLDKTLNNLKRITT